MSSNRFGPLSNERRQLLARMLEARGAKGRQDDAIRRRPDATSAPLSLAQQRLWFLSELEPESRAYTLVDAVRVTGALDVGALERALAEVARRHEVLRTRFVVRDGTPEQHVAAPDAPPRGGFVPLARDDVAALPDADRLAAARRAVDAEAAAPFDLGNGPVARARLVRLDDGDHVLAVATHHIVSDGWSTAIFLQEVVALYAAAVGAPAPPLPELSIQYGDYAAWQRDGRTGERVAADVAHWSDQLAGAPLVLELPGDRPRPPAKSGRGARVHAALGADRGAALRAFAQARGATPFMVLFSALATVLARWTGQRDLLVGVPFANRPRRELEPLLGFFMNTLVMRADLSGAPSFAELVGRVRRTALEAYDRQEAPFEAVVQALSPDRDLTRTPVVQVAFNLLNQRPVELRAPGFEVAPFDCGDPSSKFDFTLYARDDEAGTSFELVYDPDLFDAARMGELLAQIELVLAAGIAAPDRSVFDVPLVTAAARAALPAVEARGAARATSPGASERVAAHARARPGAPALVDAKASWTYADVDEVASALALALRGAGVAAGDVVAVFADRAAALGVALLGAHRAGAAFLVLDPAYPPARLAAYLGQARPTACVAIASAGPPPAEVVDALGGAPLLTVPPDPAGARELFAASIGTRAPDGGAPGPGDLAYVVFTSGSSGVPKAVLGEHGPLAHFFDWHVERFGTGASDRVSVLSGLAHDPLLRDVLLPLWSGGVAVFPDAATVEDPARVAGWLAEARVTIAHLTPALARVAAEAAAPAAWGALRLVGSGGDALTGDVVAALRRAAPSARVVNFYGTTETPQAHASFEVAEDPPARAVIPIGRGIDGVDLLVVAAAGLAGVGELGEVVVRSPYLARGYGAGAEDASRFGPSPLPGGAGERCFRTGDLGRYLPGGDVAFAGRADAQLNLRGVRIEPAEVEAALRAHPDVAAAAVIAVGEADSARLAAFVSPRPGATLDADAVRELARSRLPAAMVPTSVAILDALPLTPNRKLDRRSLAALASPAASAARVPPRGPLEEQVAAIYGDVLGVTEVARDDDFFLLGGHSLLAARVVARVRSSLGVDLELRELFLTPNVRGLAAAVERRVADSEASGRPALGRRPGGAPPPLGFAQERLWFLEQLVPGSAAYVIAAGLRVVGALDADALEQALQLVVDRHEALRTGFTLVAGAGVASVAASGRLGLARVSLANLDDAPRREALEARIARIASAPFDLAAPPLIRAELVALGPGEHALLFAMHHIVSDLWSIGVLVREVAAAYAALAAGRAPELPELPVQYGDFAAWQRAWLEGAVLEQQLGYWRRELEGAPAALELPTDRPRVALGARRAARVPFGLDAETTRRIEELCRGEGATTFMALLAALQVLLARLSGQGEVVIGAPVANRRDEALEGLIGLFVNTVALRGRLADDPTFREHLRRTKDAALAAFAHQDVPFEKVVDAIGVRRDLTRTPVFQAAFAWQNAPMPPLDVAGLSFTQLDVETGAAKFDLLFMLFPRVGAVDGWLEYDADLFDRSTAERLVERLTTLLASAIATPDARVTRLPLLAPGERAQLLAWSAPSAALEVRDTLGERFLRAASARPDAIAVRCEGDALTYAELREQALRLATVLAARGVGPEQGVGVQVGRTIALPVAILGVVLAGGVYVPLDPDAPADRRAHVVRDAGLKIVVTDASATLAFEGAESVPWNATAPDGARPPEPRATPDSAAYVIYTSGSTGRPKGTPVTHRNVLRLFDATRPWYRFDEHDIWALFHSSGFDVSVWEMWGALLHGGELVVVPYWVAASPDAFHALLAERRVTVLNQTPSAFRPLIEADRHGADLALRIVVFAGEALEPASLRDWVARHGDERPELVNMYGITETTVHVTYRRLRSADVFGEHRSVIGRAMPDLGLYVLDPTGELAPLGVVGELHVAGDGVARGYLGVDPELTAERFVPDGLGERPGGRLYRSGDLARWLPSGELEYLGRIDHQVKIRGYRIELGEIEATLLADPSVREAAVLARDRGPGDRELVAYLVARGSEAPSAVALRERLAATLPGYMVPAAYVVLDALPLTVNGKLDRRALPAPERGDADRAGEPPRGPVEEALARLVADVLGLARVGRDDDFFALGGHSLSAMKVVARVRASLGVELPVRALFEAPTVAGMAARVEALRGTDAASAPIAPASPPFPLSFGQERLWFLQQMAPDSAAYNVPGAIRARGRLDLEALRLALEAATTRHEALRTTFEDGGDGEPRAVVRAPEAFELVVEPVGVADGEALEAAIARLAAPWVARPFDLVTGPLFRARAFGVGPEDHALVFVAHHAVADAWSLEVLIREVVAAYGAALRGEALALPEPPIRYVDYAAWQRELATAGVLDAQIAFWKRALADLPHLALPIDRPRPPAPSFAGARVPVTLSRETTAALGALARDAGTTLFVTVLTAFAALLARYAGDGDVPIGTPVANRTRPEVQDVVGFFVNTVVVRADLADDPPFVEAMGRVRDAVLGALANQDAPFERLVEVLNPERQLGHSALFNVFFAMQGVPAEAIRLPGLEITPLDWDRGTTKFDLTLSVNTGEQLAGFFEYRTELFDRATVEGLARAFVAVADAAAAAPATRATRLGASPDDAARLRAENATEAAFEPIPVHRLVERLAEEAPEAPAVELGSEVLRRGELDRRADALAARLRALGVGPERRVGIFIDRRTDLVVAVLAVLKAGGAWVPLDVTLPGPRLAQMIADADPAVVLTVAALAPEAPAHPRLVIVDEAPPAAPGPARYPAPPLDALAYVIFTSGSTGRPKGAMLTHRALTNLVQAQVRDFDLGPRHRVLQFVSFSFDVSVSEIFMALVSGATLVMAPSDALLPGAGLMQLLRDRRITTVSLPASVLAASPVHALPDLGNLIVGGETCPEPVLERWSRERRLFNCYGPTEAGVCATMARWTDAAERPGIGRPIANVRAYVLDASLAPLPAGAIGELYLAGAGVGRGYLGRPELTAERFLPDPFAPGARMYRTGDRARLLRSGAIEFLGRADEQVKVRGFRIELGEIESALARHPAVGEAAVVVREDTPGDRRLVAYVVASGNAAASPQELRRFLQGSVPDYMVPAVVAEIAALPRTATGKLDRRTLPAPDARGQLANEFVAPRTRTEQRLAAIWEHLLGVHPIGVTDNFFDVGGNSFLVIKMQTEVRRTLGQQLPMAAVFEEGTIEQLARQLDERVQTTPKALVRVRRGQGRPPLYFVHPVGGNVVCYGTLARLLAADRPMYGLQARGAEGDAPPRDDIEEMAAAYVEELLAVHEGGPFGIVGWSFGGTVAFEMGAQLRARGHDVGLLVLLDSSAPVGRVREVSDDELMRVLLRDLVGIFGIRLSATFEELARMAPAELEAFAVRQLESAKIFTPGTEERELRRHVVMYRSHMNAHLRYRPRPYEGAITFVQAADHALAFRREILEGWRELARGPFDVVLAPGVHVDMLKRPHVEGLARCLQPYIDGLVAAETSRPTA